MNCYGLDTIQSNNAVLTISPSGIIEINNAENNIIIYPNPTHDNIFINYLQVIQEIKIIDMIGQVIYQEKIPDQNISRGECYKNVVGK